MFAYGAAQRKSDTAVLSGDHWSALLDERRASAFA
jgi:hypothetical protein